MTATFKLSAFGDEIADSLTEQIETLGNLNIKLLELRGVWGKNVLQLSDDEVAELKDECSKNGISVSAIGSPIGKSFLDAPPQDEMDNLERIVEIAQRLNVSAIRIFSFYPPEGTTLEEHDSYLGPAGERLARMAAYAKDFGMTLLLENEKGIVGDTISRCHTLLRSVESTALRFAWDPANFVQVGELSPTTNGWPLLGPYVAHVHVKDALSSGEVRVAGQGEGEIAGLLDRLVEADYHGVLALEPHLIVAGHSSGYSGSEGMAKAANALRELMARRKCMEV